jgi:hypothetical protein
VGGVDPPDDTTPSSVFESGTPEPGLSTCDAPGDGSAVGSAAPMPGWAIAAAQMPSATTRAPAERMCLESLTALPLAVVPSDVVL